MLFQVSPLPFWAVSRRLNNSVLFCFVLLGLLVPGAAAARGQATQSIGSGVSRTAKAVTFRRGGVAKVSLLGTNLTPAGSSEAQIENKGNRVEIDVKFEGLEPATKFGFEYLTYAFWAISPQGRAVNLGEVSVKNGGDRRTAFRSVPAGR